MNFSHLCGALLCSAFLSATLCAAPADNNGATAGAKNSAKVSTHIFSALEKKNGYDINYKRGKPIKIICKKGSAVTEIPIDKSDKQPTFTNQDSSKKTIITIEKPASAKGELANLFQGGLIITVKHACNDKKGKVVCTRPDGSTYEGK